MTRRRFFRPSRWALLLLIAALVAVAADMYLPAGLFPAPEHRVILVQRGQTLRQVADELKRVGLLSGTLGFQVLARAMRLDRTIKAGQYSFQLGTSVPALLRALARGMSGLNVVTIPEGLTTSEVSLLLSNHLGVPVAEFDSLAQDRAFLDSLGIAAPSVEGYLAPDSYEFLPGTSPEVAFRTMARRTLEILLRAAAGRDSLPLGMSLHQVLTLASIVEAEAMVDVERPRIATVYLNRLEMGMRLQADPTVGYAIGRGPRTRLLLRHLRVDSPFNTYLYQGLPPGPICNPGRASIAAVIDPLPGIKELYFVADGYGRHLFSRTYEEHLAKIRQVRGGNGSEQAPESARSVARPESASRKPAGAVALSAGTARATAPSPADTTAARKGGTAGTKKLAPVSAARPETTAVKKPATGTGGKPGTTVNRKPAATASKPAGTGTTVTTATGTTTARSTASQAADTSAVAKKKSTKPGTAASAAAKPPADAASGSSPTKPASQTAASASKPAAGTTSKTSTAAKKPATKDADTTAVAKKAAKAKPKPTATKKPATDSKPVASGTP